MYNYKIVIVITTIFTVGVLSRIERDTKFNIQQNIFFQKCVSPIIRDQLIKKVIISINDGQTGNEW